MLLLDSSLFKSLWRSYMIDLPFGVIVMMFSLGGKVGAYSGAA